MVGPNGVGRKYTSDSFAYPESKFGYIFCYMLEANNFGLLFGK